MRLLGKEHHRGGAPLLTRATTRVPTTHPPHPPPPPTLHVIPIWDALPLVPATAGLVTATAGLVPTLSPLSYMRHQRAGYPLQVQPMLKGRATLSSPPM